jgi:hypothetical protein
MPLVDKFTLGIEVGFFTAQFNIISVKELSSLL